MQRACDGPPAVGPSLPCRLSVSHALKRGLAAGGTPLCAPPTDSSLPPAAAPPILQWDLLQGFLIGELAPSS